MIIIKTILVTIFYGVLYYTLESVFNAIFTKPHNDRINNIMRTEKEYHVLETIGFTRLVMIPFAMLVSLSAWLLFLIPVVTQIWWSGFIYVFVVGIVFTLLELSFGYSIFKIFKVRLWDYRSEKLNILEFTSVKHYGIWTFLSFCIYGFNWLWYLV